MISTPSMLTCSVLLTLCRLLVYTCEMSDATQLQHHRQATHHPKANRPMWPPWNKTLKINFEPHS